MANGNAYPAVMLAPEGQAAGAGVTLQFTDSDDQPGGGAATPPFHAAPTGATAIMVDSPDGDPILAFDADTPAIDAFYDLDMGGSQISNVSNLSCNSLNSAGFQGGQFVSSQAGAPDPIGTYIGTPFVYDTTAVTGGCYGWDGTEYVKISNVVT